MLIQNFFLQLVVILCVARLFGELVARFGIPSVIGELLAGVLIGPSLLNLMHSSETIQLLAEIGIILLLFEVGLETDIRRLARTGSRPFIVAVGGVVLPFSMGFVLSYYVFDFNFLISLLIASTLTATSIGITVRVLTDLKKQNTDEAQIVLGAAVIDDIIGIILLSIVYEFSQSGEISLLNIEKIFAYILSFMLIAPVAAKLIANLIKFYDDKSEIPGLLPTSIVSLILLFSWIAHQLGAPLLLGGFSAGLALSKQFFIPPKNRWSLSKYFLIDEEFSHRVETHMRPIVHLFTPIFFVSIGLSLDLSTIPWNSSFIWLLSLSLLAVACIGKLLSGFLLFKDSILIKCAVGIAMIPRGEVGLIFAEVGKANRIFNNDLYAAMIIVIAVTTIFAPFMLRIFYSYQNKTPEEIKTE